MILAQPEIRAAVDNGEIRFDPPLEDSQWGEVSVDLRLGNQFTKLSEAEGAKFSVAKGLSTIGASGLWVSRDLTNDEFGVPQTQVLEPNDFVLVLTHERITIPRHLIALVEGRSTYATVGLTMHQTAPWIQPGWSGRITLEIRNSGPLNIELTPLIDRPCQLTFFQLTSPLDESTGYCENPRIPRPNPSIKAARVIASGRKVAEGPR